MQTSTSFSLNKADLLHIGRHFLYAALAGGIGYILTSVLPNLSITGTAAIFLPIAVTLLTTVQSYFANNQ